MTPLNPVDLCIAAGAAFMALYGAYFIYRTMSHVCMFLVRIFVAAVIVSVLYKYAWEHAFTIVWQADRDSGSHLHRWLEESTLLSTLNVTTRPLYEIATRASGEGTLSSDVQAAASGFDTAVSDWIAFARSASNLLLGLSEMTTETETET